MPANAQPNMAISQSTEFGATNPTRARRGFWFTNDAATDFAQKCEESGVIVRAFAGDGVRVTISSPGENDAFLDCV